MSVEPSTEETHGHFWCSRDQMGDLLAGKSITMSRGEAGLESVWHDWFTELDVLRQFPKW